MSYGVVCLTCKKYVRVGAQTVEGPYAEPCECETPRYSVDARTECTKAEAEREAEIWYGRKQPSGNRAERRAAERALRRGK